MSTTHVVRKAPDARRLPPVLPVIAMTIAADGTMTVAVDGAPLDPPRFGPPWVRSSFAAVIDSVLRDRGSPVRVLVYGADGTVFTDLITRPLQRELDPTTQPSQRETSPAESAHAAEALIVRHTKASADGSARALLEPGICQVGVAGEVVLVGRISGTCVIGDLT